MSRTNKHTQMRALRQLPVPLYPKTTEESEQRKKFEQTWSEFGFKSDIATRRRQAATRKTSARTKARCRRAQKRGSKPSTATLPAD